jgi:hypothetical protein
MKWNLDIYWDSGILASDMCTLMEKRDNRDL